MNSENIRKVCEAIKKRKPQWSKVFSNEKKDSLKHWNAITMLRIELDSQPKPWNN